MHTWAYRHSGSWRGMHLCVKCLSSDGPFKDDYRFFLTFLIALPLASWIPSFGKHICNTLRNFAELLEMGKVLMNFVQKCWIFWKLVEFFGEFRALYRGGSYLPNQPTHLSLYFVELSGTLQNPAEPWGHLRNFAKICGDGWGFDELCWNMLNFLEARGILWGIRDVISEAIYLPN